MEIAVVVGATGDVGTGVVAALLKGGFQVIAVGRSQDRLDDLKAFLGSPRDLRSLVGSVASEDAAQAIAQKVLAVGQPSAVVVTINGKPVAMPLPELTASDLMQTFRENVAPHLVAAKTLIPILSDGGVYLGIGGGMADLTFPGMTAISAAQAAQRSLFRYLATDPAYGNSHVRELILYSMIAGRSKTGVAQAHWISADEVGTHVTTILSDPKSFEGPILTLKSRKQVGQPERAAG